MNFETKQWAEKQFQSFANKISSTFAKINNLSQVSFSGNYNDLSETPNIPDKLSQLENDIGFAKNESPTFTGCPNAPTPNTSSNNTQIATTEFVKTLISNLINGAPETLDTLKEIADALDQNDNVLQVINEAIANKADRSEIPTKTSQLINDDIISLDNISGTEGDVLQFKNGQWTAEKPNEESINIDIISTIDEIESNEIKGKLVDALVIKEVFQSVSDGKSKIALAITDKGVNTSAKDTFLKMAENIGIISGNTGSSDCGCYTIKQITNFSMPAPDGQLQITTILSDIIALAKEPTVNSFAKANITVTEG